MPRSSFTWLIRPCRTTWYLLLLLLVEWRVGGNRIKAKEPEVDCYFYGFTELLLLAHLGRPPRSWKSNLYRICCSPAWLALHALRSSADPHHRAHCSLTLSPPPHPPYSLSPAIVVVAHRNQSVPFKRPFSIFDMCKNQPLELHSWMLSCLPLLLLLLGRSRNRGRVKDSNPLLPFTNIAHQEPPLLLPGEIIDSSHWLITSAIRDSPFPPYRQSIGIFAHSNRPRRRRWTG